MQKTLVTPARRSFSIVDTLCRKTGGRGATYPLEHTGILDCNGLNGAELEDGWSQNSSRRAMLSTADRR